jgi:dipeptidyl aminopeptidase/acylaminoacyl peptidase
METPAEAPFVQAVLEAAIDTLDARGLIDRGKVGMQGFSRTCFYTLYFLTHSSFPIAAADITDGVDYNYFQTLAFVDNDDKINGGPPWGPTHAAWVERTSGFRLDRVTAPLRVTAIQPYSLLQEWEPYVGLLLQHKPVELVYLPDGAHVLVKPWERLTSQQGAVDWWRFWLQGYEDPNPTKADQYARWRQLRVQRDSSAALSSFH